MPNQDALLHLCLTSCKGFTPLRDVSMAQIPFCKAFASVERLPMQSRRVLVTLAMVPIKTCGCGWCSYHGSHRNGLDGITFPDFFSALLYELGMQSTLDRRIEFPES
ncbi:hypothetical protein GQ600_16695 [Phytophthora cactorum]|nr:hypothetical protein GQ600_16695 [Phytophthora cactorum]